MQTNNIKQIERRLLVRETSNQKINALRNTGFIVLPEVKKEVEVTMEVRK